jgi:hypothetical protein
MVFSLEVVGVGKKNITRRIHIKYVDNTDFENKTYGLDGKNIS